MGHGDVATELILVSTSQSCMVQVFSYVSGINHEHANLNLENDQDALVISEGNKH